MNILNYTNHGKSIILGLKPYYHSLQQYTRLNARHDDEHGILYLQYSQVPQIKSLHILFYFCRQPILYRKCIVIN